MNDEPRRPLFRVHPSSFRVLMKGMILAAGFGTRLRPVTWTLPKPMVPLCNRPLIAWAVESYLAAGVNEIIVNLHHLPEAIERYLHARYDGDATFHFSREEEEILGTGGGVRRIRALVEHDDAFFLVNGDTVQFPRYDALRDAQYVRGALAALTLRHPPAGDKFTAVWLEDDLITGFGTGSGEPLMFAGSHAISTRIFQCLPDRDVSHIVEDVYSRVINDRTEVVAGIVDDGLWFDVGSPQRYRNAARDLLAAIVAGDVPPPRDTRVHGDSLADDSAAISGTLTRSCAGARSVVEGTLVDSAVWDDCAIASGARLEGCIVSHGVEIGEGVELRDSLIVCDDSAIPADATCERRDGLVIVPI